MRNDRALKSRIFSRRVFILSGFKFFIMFVFACRMFFLQIIKSKEYKTLSDKNSINIIFIEPERGKIFDSSGVQLAVSVKSYKLVLYRQKTTDINYLLNNLTNILVLDKSYQQRLAKKMQSSPYLRPTVLQDNLSWHDVCKFEEVSYELEGLYIDKGLIRDYKFHDLYSHVIGYMGVPNNTEIKTYNLTRYKNFKVGKAGIEKFFESSLIGQFGMKKVEVNAYRSIVRELSEQHSKAGNDLRLTINHTLQDYVFHSLKNECAIVVVMNIQNGNVLSMLSTPTFDPNLFSHGISEEQWYKIISNKSLPLTNKAIAKLYPPGSTFKMAVALAILYKGLDPEHKIFCSGAVEINGHTFKCWKKGGHGNVNLHQAITGSCNCYFYLMGLQAGIDNIHRIANLLGIGHKTNISLPGELGGINPDKEWKKKLYNQNWFIGDTVNITVGQGYLLATPLQLVTMTARIASGYNVLPRLVSNVAEQKLLVAKFTTIDINPDHLALVKRGLESVINDPHGTGFSNRITEHPFKMAGKTGTSQVISVDTAENKSFAKHLRSHSIFTGFAPIHDPRFACVVIVDHGGWGSAKAAPLAKDILLYTQLHC